jgi:hypothetical protein
MTLPLLHFPGREPAALLRQLRDGMFVFLGLVPDALKIE